MLLHEMKSYWAIVTEDSMDAPMRAWVPVADRIATPKVKAGMSVREMNGLIGCPDAETYEEGADCYDYDIDGLEPQARCGCACAGPMRRRACGRSCHRCIWMARSGMVDGEWCRKTRA